MSQHSADNSPTRAQKVSLFFQENQRIIRLIRLLVQARENIIPHPVDSMIIEHFQAPTTGESVWINSNLPQEKSCSLSVDSRKSFVRLLGLMLIRVKSDHFAQIFLVYRL